MTMQYARCNWMLSLALDENGDPCRFMATAETTDGVVSTMSNHIESVHSQDPAGQIMIHHAAFFGGRTLSHGLPPRMAGLNHYLSGRSSTLRL